MFNGGIYMSPVSRFNIWIIIHWDKENIWQTYLTDASMELLNMLNELSALGSQIFIKLPFDRSVVLSDSEEPQGR